MSTERTNNAAGMTGQSRDSQPVVPVLRPRARLDAERRELFLGASPAVLCRAMADGELTAQELTSQGLTSQSLREDADQVAGCVRFERGLRASVARAMQAPAMPVDLRARVAAALAQQNESLAMTEGLTEGLAEGLAARAAQTRSSSFWASAVAGRAVRTFGAIAAGVAVAAAGVFMLNQGQPTGTKGLGGVGPLSQVGGADFRASLASFVSREHLRVSSNAQAAEAKLNHHTLDETRSFLADRFGEGADLPGPIDDAVAFVGCGGCNVPGAKSSSHMQFRLPAASAGDEERVVSLFIGDNPGDLGLEPGVTYRLDDPAAAKLGASIFVFTDGTLLFTFVSIEDGDGASCQRLLKTMHLPEASRSI